ncbi:MAG: type 4a pilus biogenesis protein PilO [Patescibacteria group bacterium]
MKKISFASTEVLRERTMRELQQFYQKPIAKVSVELLATLIVVIVLAFFAIRPTLLTMSQLLKDIDDRKKTGDSLSKKIATLSTLSAEYPTMRREVSLLDIAIPNTPNFDGFMRRLEKIAANNNLIIESIQATQLPKETATNIGADTAFQITSFSISINFKGEYAKVRNTLNELMTMDRYATLNSLTFNAKRDELEKTNVLRTTANLRVVYYGTPPPVPKKDGT